ncbi:hypothetical protein PENSUB_7813 [Penicillium subrubescens]|uniref:Uncharacterized protein n=1 Tax=Penicillium subrubescens TaxID=1316194 RepID=A0A1Q5TJG5_9EURO|nr:hypothetical protein PENSUB_7813 [Penicillium subrubescens]
MKPTGNMSSPDLTIKTSAWVARLEKTSMTTGMTGSSSVKRSTDSVVGGTMEHPSGHRGNWVGVPTRSPRGPLKKMTSVLFTAKSDMSVDMASTSPSEFSAGTVIHHPVKPISNSSSLDLSIKTTASAVRLENTSMTIGMTGSSSVKRSTNSVVDGPMKHRSRRVSSKPVERNGRKVPAVPFECCSCGEEDCLAPSPPLTAPHTPVKSTGLNFVRADYQCCEGGQDGGTLPCPSTTTSYGQRDGYFGQKKLARPSEGHPCRLGNGTIPMSPIPISPSQADGMAGKLEKSVALEDCQLEEGEVMLPSPALTGSSMKNGNLELDKESSSFQRCSCGQPNCIIPNSPNTPPITPSLPSEATGALPPTSREVQPRETSSRLAWENYVFCHKPLGYDYLESCPDFRALHDNEYAVGGWAIGEGSLVIGINPRYVVPTGDVQPLDQLELKEGKLYIVERIHGDLWALVKEFSTTKPHNGRTPGPPNQVVRLGFVPICAVTLAANYSSFVERCREYEMYPDIRRLTPTNGARISPPVRIESLAASREVDRWMLAGRNNWESKDAHIVCSKFRPIRDSECLYEPKDKLSRMKLMVNKPRQAWKKLTTKKLEVLLQDITLSSKTIFTQYNLNQEPCHPDQPVLTGPPRISLPSSIYALKTKAGIRQSGQTIRRLQVVVLLHAIHVGSDRSIGPGIGRVMCPERGRRGPSIDRGRGIKSREL